MRLNATERVIMRKERRNCNAKWKRRFGVGMKESVKETMNWRYLERAGVMSRNERDEEERLFVWTVILQVKAYSLLRVTVVREGISVCEDRMIGNTLQSDGTRKLERITAINSCECCESRQVYSSVHFIITTSHDQFTWVIIVEHECTGTKPDRNQFRQVYSSFSFW